MDVSFSEVPVTDATQNEDPTADATQNEDEPLMRRPDRIMRKKSTIHDYLSTSGYYTCISKEPLPLRWNLNEDSPAGIVFEAGNVVRMRSFVYEEPYLWAEILSGGFVCAGIGDDRREAAGDLLEEYFEPYRLPGETVEEDKQQQSLAFRRLERHATSALEILHCKTPKGDSSPSKDKTAGGSPSGSPRNAASEASSSSSSDDDDGTSERILELFQLFDVNLDGTIELDELVRVLQSLDAKKWTHASCAKLLQIMDTNQDRQVSYEEFVDWICGTCRWRKERRAFFKQLGVETGDLQEMQQEGEEKRGAVMRKSIAMWQ